MRTWGTKSVWYLCNPQLYKLRFCHHIQLWKVGLGPHNRLFSLSLTTLKARFRLMHGTLDLWRPCRFQDPIPPQVNIVLGKVVCNTTTRRVIIHHMVMDIILSTVRAVYAKVHRPMHSKTIQRPGQTWRKIEEGRYRAILLRVLFSTKVHELPNTISNYREALYYIVRLPNYAYLLSVTSFLSSFIPDTQ